MRGVATACLRALWSAILVKCLCGGAAGVALHLPGWSKVAYLDRYTQDHLPSVEHRSVDMVCCQAARYVVCGDGADGEE